MVATRSLTFGPPIPASPARLRADPTKLAFIKAWIKDFPVESISTDAGAITDKLKELSFDSFASLYHMDDSYIAVLESKGFNSIHAKLIVRDAKALHETAPIVTTSFPPVKSIKPFPPWTTLTQTLTLTPNPLVLLCITGYGFIRLLSRLYKVVFFPRLSRYNQDGTGIKQKIC